MRRKGKVMNLLLASVMALEIILVPGVQAQAQGIGNEVFCGASETVTETNRQELDFNRNWLFLNKDDPNARESDYNEAQAKQVSLPHSLGEYDLFYTKNSDWEKVTWYRRHFSIPKSEEGKRVEVYFDGGGQINQVYVNGALVGTAKGTFTHFSFDISDFITYGDFDNVISVQVDSCYHKDTLPPADGDFHWMGGLHGDAKLTITNPLYVSSAFHYTQKIGTATYTEGSPVKLISKITVGNEYSTSKNAVLRTKVLDKEGKMVGTKEQNVTVSAAGQLEVPYEIEIANPKLWSPDSPYLYEVETSVEIEGKSVDSIKTKTGLRWIATTGKTAKNTALTAADDKQILLNDKPIILYGINKNSQFSYIGNSGTKKMNEKDAYTLKYDLGVNFVRTAHYQNDPDFFAACDEIGLLVEEEALGWNTMPAVARPQFRESVIRMVERDRNHPSIIIWSIVPNEGTQANYPVVEKQELQTKTKELDPSRLTIQEEMFEDYDFVTDVYANHDYVVSTDANPVRPIKRQPYVIGEWNDNLGRVFITPYDSEDRKIRQVLDDGKKLAAFMKDKTIDGYLKWDFNGYLTPMNNNKLGKNIGVYRVSGIYGPYKDPENRYWEAELLRSQVSSEVVGNVVSILHDWKADSPNVVYIAANAPFVELYQHFADGRKVQIGQKIAPNTLTDLWQGLFKFENVTFADNSWLEAVSYDAGGKELARDIQYASGYDVPADATYQLANVTANSYSTEHYMTYGKDYHKDNLKILADGGDLAVISGVLKDAKGQKLDYAYENADFEIVSGPGRLIKGPNIYMLGGTNQFYLQSEYNKPGITTLKGKVDVGTMINQDVAENFKYSATGWTTQTNKNYSYKGDYQKSSEAGAYVDITFTGTQAVLYAQSDVNNYGAANITVDGGAVQNCNFQKGENKVGDMSYVPIFTTAKLAAGNHTIRVTAKTAAAITIDAIKVFDGVYEITSQPITVESVAVTNPQVSSNPTLPKAPKKEIIQKSDVAALNTQALTYDLDAYEITSAWNLKKELIATEKLLNITEPRQEELRNTRDRLSAAIAGLKPIRTKVLFSAASDNEGGTSGFYRYSKNANTWQQSTEDLYANKNRQAGDFISLAFEGTQVELYQKKDTSHGYAKVYVDNVFKEKIDQYSATDESNAFMYRSPILEKGTHTIKIEVTNETSGNPQNACVGVSFAYIFSEQIDSNVSKTALNDAVTRATGIQKEGHDVDLYNQLQEQIAQAQFVKEHPYANNAIINKLVTDIQTTIQLFDTSIPVNKIESSELSKQLMVGETYSLNYTVLPDNATNKAVSYENSDSSVVRIVQGNTIEALKVGTSRITVKSVTNPQVFVVIEINVVEKPPVIRTGWIREDGKTYYYKADGTMTKDWAEIEGKWYYFKADGVMASGWQQIGENWYYLKADGVRASGWQQIGKNWYYLRADGIRVTGWDRIGNSWYYFKNDGIMATGWQKIGQSWYYLKSGGTMATGWQKVGQSWYYLKSSGIMATGWQKVGQSWYYLKSSGIMATGWQKVGQSWYYLKSSGIMATGWQKVGQSWYYLKSSGIMATGWLKDKGVWYYLKPSGIMATGWILQNNKWYYLLPSGKMAVGWLKQGTTWYYLEPSGVMDTGSRIIQNTTYNFDRNGKWIK